MIDERCASKCLLISKTFPNGLVNSLDCGLLVMMLLMDDNDDDDDEAEKDDIK